MRLAESVQVEYDSSVVSYEELLQVFWKNHRPKPSERGQYRSCIWYHNEAQRQSAEESLPASSSSTRVAAATEFHEAEVHHQKTARGQKNAHTPGQHCVSQ
mmetsp:Transcript_3452/g.4037  ORF Transcript_3452/g.4037 Transcript_3452/m.4037 type:complete len:101 (-) Transcript_3452:102-404(-)